MKRPTIWVVAAVLAPIMSAAAVLMGAWWAPFPLALAFGLVQPSFRIASPVGVMVGVIGWGVALVVLQSRYDIQSAAESISAILGLGQRAGFAVAITLLIGGLLGFTGAWLGSAIRTFAIAGYPAISRWRAAVSSDGSTPSSAASSLRKSR